VEVAGFRDVTVEMSLMQGDLIKNEKELKLGLV